MKRKVRAIFLLLAMPAACGFVPAVAGEASFKPDVQLRATALPSSVAGPGAVPTETDASAGLPGAPLALDAVLSESPLLRAEAAPMDAALKPARVQPGVSIPEASPRSGPESAGTQPHAIQGNSGLLASFEKTFLPQGETPSPARLETASPKAFDGERGGRGDVQADLVPMSPALSSSMAQGLRDGKSSALPKSAAAAPVPRPSPIPTREEFKLLALLSLIGTALFFALVFALVIHYSAPFVLGGLIVTGLLAAAFLYGSRAKAIPGALARRGQFSLKGLFSVVTLIALIFGYGRMLANDIPRLDSLAQRQHKVADALEYNRTNWSDAYPNQPQHISFGVFVCTLRNIHWGVNDQNLENFSLLRLYTGTDGLYDVRWLVGGNRTTPWTEEELKAAHQNYLNSNPAAEATLEEFRIIAQAHRLFLEVKDDPVRRRDLESLYFDFLNRVVAPNAPKQDWDLGEHRRRAAEVFSADRTFRWAAVKHGGLTGLFFVFAALLLRPVPIEKR